MKRCYWLLFLLMLPWAIVCLDADARDKKPGKSISWKKIVLDRNFRSEGAGVADVNKDGKMDVIVGDCWYEAPKVEGGEWKRHILREYFDAKLMKFVPADRKWDLGVYTDAFCCFADDFSGDGYPDVIVIPFPGRPCFWYENPGEKGGLWKQHFLTNSACNETPIYVDLFKNGTKLLVMGWNPLREDGKGSYNDRGEMCYFVPAKDPTKPWTRVSISGPSTKGKEIPGTQMFSHGLGHGDVNSDGRVDIIVPQGWWEQPEKPEGKPWKFHAAAITEACADMYTMDIDGDGKSDIISTSAHNYGFWWSQQKDANSFVKRIVFPNPFEVAKLPQSVKFSKEEKDLYDAINKVRTDHFKRSPFAAHPELCRMAHVHAERLAKADPKETVNIAGTYSGKVLTVSSRRDILPSDATKEPKKGELSFLQRFAKALLPDQDKNGALVLPGFEIGVGAVKLANGDIQATLIIGDRQQFSLPSQTHALHMVDINGDGLKDFVTGRRWWAHGPRGDAGPNDPAYLYWFQAKRGKDGMISFTPHVIDDNSGIGTSFAIADMNGDRLPDVIVANKKGVHVLLQQR